MRMPFIAITMVLLAGCSTTVPVSGQFSGTHDPFMGEASAALFGTGSLRIQSQDGTACQGTLVRPTSLLSGHGAIQCSDGRTGTFVFTKSNEMGGTGFGTLSDGEKFRFMFGNDIRGSTIQCDETATGKTCSRY